MDLVIWAALLRRSKSECERHCPRQCDTVLEVEHRYPRALGGETSLANCMLLCAEKNREKGMTPDPTQWLLQSRFDDKFNYDALRPSQKENIENVFYWVIFSSGLCARGCSATFLFWL
jgi:hypothetical protein